MLKVRSFLGMALCGIFLTNPTFAEVKNLAPPNQAFDSVMPTYERIDWVDPLNPRYVNLGDDKLMVDTQRGIYVWNIATNSFSNPQFSKALADSKIERLDYGRQTWARLGATRGNDTSSGTAFVGVSTNNRDHRLYWWQMESSVVSADLPIDGKLKPPSLHALDRQHLLMCWYGKGSKLVRLTTGAMPHYEWVTPGIPEVQALLRDTGVVGPVDGYSTLNTRDISRPVFYDTKLCSWGIVAPPEHLRSALDKDNRLHEATIKPYFLADGQILLSEGSYFDGGWKHLSPPLLWQPTTGIWRTIEAPVVTGDVHRSGMEEPVMAHGLGSEFVEFLDTSTMRWIRSSQRLPETYGANIEPLSDGQALVILRDSMFNKGVTGMLSPMRAKAPRGQLALERYRYDNEIVTDFGLMLVGGGNEWNPTTRSEVIDAALYQARPIASLPAELVSPYGLQLKDGSTLVFGGLPARCGPSFYFFRSEPCSRLPARPSYRYFPQGDHWQALPQLAIPFTRGYWWQTGNSGLTSQWARNDARVRNNGDVVWIEGGENFGSDAEQNMPQTSVLKRWSSAHPDLEPDMVAPLRKARTQSTLVELADGRLAVVGGYAQLERVALEKTCFDCPDEFVSIGPFREARTTEILEEVVGSPAAWQPGPTANFGGGRAVKLANGNIFKLSRIGGFDEYGYRAEIADAAFTRWKKLPPFPLKQVLVENVGVAGNYVVIFTKTAQTVAWDDDSQRWLVWAQWPRGVGNNDDPPLSVTEADGGKRVLIRYKKTFDIMTLPVQ